MAMQGRDSLSTEDNDADEESDVLVPHCHIKHVCTKISKTVGILQKLKYADTMKQLPYLTISYIW